MKRVTIRDVAREAKVSVTLVSFVMNAKRDSEGNLDCPVNPNTARRVLQVAQRLGYRRNFAAASLRSGKSNIIAVIPNDISNRFFAGISRCVEDKAHELGYNVFFASSDEKADKLDNIIETVMAHNIDGIIVAPCMSGVNAIKKAIDSKVPVVLLDRDEKSLDKGKVGKVLLDDSKAGAMATYELLDNGCEKVEMLSYSLGISSFSERERGYREAMMNRGFYGNVNIHCVPYGKDVTDKIVEIVEDAVEREVDGIFASSYTLSACLLAAFKKKGLKTPKDIAIVGFDSSDVFSLYENTVTHVVQPLRKLGEKSVDVLVKMINGEPAEQIQYDPELVDGESSKWKKKK